MGTLVTLHEPVDRLRAALAARGVSISRDASARALAAEIAVYRARHLEGRDEPSVEALRRDCAEVLRGALPVPIGAEPAYEALMEALRFVPLPGTLEALDRLAAAGVRVAVVSNWDASLEEALTGIGLRDRVDVVVSSAHVGVDKPDPAPLVHALTLLGVARGDAVMVGDEPGDAAAAAALGMPCALVPPGAGIGAVVDELLAIAA